MEMRRSRWISLFLGVALLGGLPGGVFASDSPLATTSGANPQPVVTCGGTASFSGVPSGWWLVAAQEVAPGQGHLVVVSGGPFVAMGFSPSTWDYQWYKGDPTATPPGAPVEGASGSFTIVECQAPATYHAVTPTRVLDTRNGTGGLGVFSSHVAQTFTVRGHGNVPANATAVTGNLTVTQQSSAGFLFAGPIAMNNPTSSTLNFPMNDDRANAVTVALSGTGTLSITYAAGTLGPTAQVIFDVTGYFTP